MASNIVQQQKKIWQDFSGGINPYLGIRQIKDNESPDAVNCDFSGKGGVKNRDGYTEIGTVSSSRTLGRGMAELHTAIIDQAIKFASDGTDTALGYGSGGAWSWVTTDKFNKDANIDSCQAGSNLYIGNGVDTMKHWTGAAWATTTNGSVIKYPTYYNNRIWGVDETNEDTLNFSGQWAASSSKLGDFVDASAGTIQLKPGSGLKIRGIFYFRDALYIWCFPLGIYKITPASAANTFTVGLITSAVGCVSYRSISQVGEDVMFTSDDGVYSLGAVVNYSDIEPRTTNKSGKIQEIFKNMTPAKKKNLVGVYFNFKYHLFYSLGASNDSCMVYDVRYNGWHDWRNIAANDAVVYTKSSGANDGEMTMYFLEPTTGKVQEMYNGVTDNGTAIPTHWFSKSFDDGMPDVIKKYIKSTFVFDMLQGSVQLKVIFDDSEIALTKTISQAHPQGGLGYNVVGKGFGTTGAITTVINSYGVPLRMKAKDRKFAIQFYISSSGRWQLNSITEIYKILPRKFPSNYKIN